MREALLLLFLHDESGPHPALRRVVAHYVRQQLRAVGGFSDRFVPPARALFAEEAPGGWEDAGGGAARQEEEEQAADAASRAEAAADRALGHGLEFFERFLDQHRGIYERHCLPRLSVTTPLLTLLGSEESIIREGEVATLWLQVIGYPLAWKKADAGPSIDWIGAKLTADIGAGLVHVELQDKKRQELLSDLQQLLRRLALTLRLTLRLTLTLNVRCLRVTKLRLFSLRRRRCLAMRRRKKKRPIMEHCWIF